MSNYGIVVIDWKDKATAKQIQEIINSLYNKNTSSIGGMAYYETEDVTLIKEVEKLCVGPMKKDDAMIMKDVRSL